MAIYVAMLRGINVGGQKIVKMERLRASFEGLGFSRVRTYVQSGNVVFEVPKDTSNKLSRRIGEKILSDFGFTVPLILRASGEMKKTVSENPFLKEKGIDSSKLHVTFLSGFPDATALRKLDTLDRGSDQFRVNGREIYLYCPEGYGRTKLSNTTFERLLSIDATTRNWKTVSTLAGMSSE
jgi:uncharacterized protein (DUF1697 family)